MLLINISSTHKIFLLCFLCCIFNCFIHRLSIWYIWLLRWLLTCSLIRYLIRILLLILLWFYFILSYVIFYNIINKVMLSFWKCCRCLIFLCIIFGLLCNFSFIIIKISLWKLTTLWYHHFSIINFWLLFILTYLRLLFFYFFNTLL